MVKYVPFKISNIIFLKFLLKEKIYYCTIFMLIMRKNMF